MSQHRTARARTYLMCRPTYFDVTYEINAWMDTSIPVDKAKAVIEWEALVASFEQYGHKVHQLEPVEGLPDMVFAANGALSVDGTVYGAKFKFPQRTAEADAHAKWYTDRGARLTRGSLTNEGEGDFTFVDGPQLILAGYGFRTAFDALGEVQEVLGKPTIGLRLVDERFYHLDTALFVLDDDNVCYFPGAFSDSSQRVLKQLFPNAIISSKQDALAFGLNSVSDGKHVWIPTEAPTLAQQLADAGYEPIPITLSELFKGGGSVKCCTAELR